MNRTEIAAELRTLSKGGLISAREVGIFVRDWNHAEAGTWSLM